MNDILDFSKIEAGKLALTSRPFALRTWLEQLLSPLAQIARKKSLELHCDVDAQVPAELSGDPDRLGQVVVNLVSNAIKFTDAGHLEVVVERAAHDVPAYNGRGRHLLHFAVRDTGIGISADQQVRIFEAFVQGDGGLHRRESGCGLGLAICARLVDLMHGRIWVESREGLGSCFHFTARFGDVSDAAASEDAVPSVEKLTATS